MSDQPDSQQHVPVFNAPGVVICLAGVLLAAHLMRVTMPSADASRSLIYQFALMPPRFDGLVSGVSTDWTYGTLGLVKALIGHVFLHGDWLHVGLNALMLLAVGSPVARLLGGGTKGIFSFLALFFLSALGGALLYFALNLPEGPPAIGASGGVSGIMACALMIDRETSQVRLFTPYFLATSAAFLVANLAMIIIGPQLTGAGIAWEAHIGGWILGALVFRLMFRKRILAG